MAFRLEDFKKTTRKSSEGSGVPASVYPHQMKDKKSLARLEVAIRTFDGLVGKRRGEMDASALTDFFGDPRLARGVVACLGQFYRYETPSFAHTIGSEAAGRLQKAGLATPMAIRACTYAHVNQAYDGFLSEAQQADCYAELGEQFGLSAHLWNALLHLDAEDNQVLTRLGRIPTPADILALYNFHSLDTPLRRATKIVLSGLALSPADAAEVRALARALDIRAVISHEGGTITLLDVEVSSLLPRRPARLSRCLLHVIQAFATRTASGHADTQIGTRKFRLAFNSEILRVLGMPLKRLDASPNFRKRFDAVQALHKDLLKRRAQGGFGGWRIKRQPEPIVTPVGVLLPDFLLTRGEFSTALLVGQETAGSWDIPLLSVPLGRKPLEAGVILAQVEAASCSLFALPEPTLPAVPGDVLALCDRAAASGLVRSADAQRALHLLDESPLIEWVRRAADPRVRYIPGVGLCSEAMVSAITQDHQTLATA